MPLKGRACLGLHWLGYGLLVVNLDHEDKGSWLGMAELQGKRRLGVSNQPWNACTQMVERHRDRDRGSKREASIS